MKKNMFLLLSFGKNMFLFLIFESYKLLGISNFYQDEICVLRDRQGSKKHLQLWKIYRKFYVIAVCLDNNTEF